MNIDAKVQLLYNEYKLAASGELYSRSRIRNILVADDPITTLESLDSYIRNLSQSEFKFGTDESIIELVLSTVSEKIRNRIEKPFHEMFEAADPLISFAERVYECIREYIVNIVKHHVLLGTLPNTGVILYFSKNCNGCYIIEYRVLPGGIDVSLAGKIDNPTGFLEMDRIDSLETPFARNVAKYSLTSGHKIVLQANTLTHVDRRTDEGVFGPTIDTLILSDIATDFVNGEELRNIFEIGCGNGHITTTLTVSKSNTLEKVYFADIDSNSVLCTYRNLKNNLNCIGSSGIETVGIISDLNNILLSEEFDLIVCNPPYITIPPNHENIAARAYSEAVSGEQLITDILRCCYNLLSKKGSILLMLSSTSLNFYKSADSGEKYKITEQYRGKGIKVPFDVEAIISDEVWLKFLLENDAIEFSNGKYYHFLRPTSFSRGDHDVLNTPIS